MLAKTLFPTTLKRNDKLKFDVFYYCYALMFTFFDIHTHIHQHDPGEIPDILDRAANVGVNTIIVAGVNIKDSENCIKLSKEYKQIFAGVGYHPTELHKPLTHDQIKQLSKLASDPNVITISEIGIDHQDYGNNRSESKDNILIFQEDAFAAQIDIAIQKQLPIVFHVREPKDNPHANSAWPTAIRVLKNVKNENLEGAAHYFQGDWKIARELINYGFYISLAKPLLKLPHLQEVAIKAPIENLVLETDAYPQPFKKNRKNWTEPREIPIIARKLAELRKVSLEQIAEKTLGNSLKLFPPNPIGSGKNIGSSLEFDYQFKTKT